MIYIHIPFCKSFCIYCGFYSETADCHSAFIDALVEEIRRRRGEIAGFSNPGTLYIGGGTPSVLPLSSVREIVNVLREAAGDEGTSGDAQRGGRFEEFTIELNPEDVVERGEAYAEALLELGVTRASMGVQSFDDRILRWMNRRHDAGTAVRAYRILERAGFENISIDLIFGLPYVPERDLPSVPRGRGFRPLMTPENWKETIAGALAISGSGKLPSHISAYQLSVEQDSALERMLAEGRCRETDDESCAMQYEILCSELSAAGYEHYEISNFALPGCRARHNSAYWRHVPYSGFGPGAHSLERLPDGRLRRSWNAADLHRYIAEFSLGAISRPRDGEFHSESGNFPFREGEILSPEQVDVENIMLGLRTSEGCTFSELKGICSPEALDRTMAAGHLVRVIDRGIPELRFPGEEDSAEPHYRIPEKKFFISDSIISSLLG